MSRTLLLLVTCGWLGLVPGQAQTPLLWFDFTTPATDGGFPCRVSAARCLVDGEASLVHGGLLASPYQRLTVTAPALDSLSEALTVAAWLAPATRPRGYQSLLYRGRRQGDDHQRIQFYLSLFDGRPEFKLKDAAGEWHGLMRNGDVFPVPGGEAVPLAGVPVVPTRRWSHVAATFDRGRVTLYLNGEAILSGQTRTTALIPSSLPLRLGEGEAAGGQRDYLFEGLLDDVRVYDVALDAAGVAALFSAERGDKPTTELDLTPALPAGYDPDFAVKLPLTAAYEQALPAARDGRQPLRARVARHGGVPLLEVDGRPVYPIAMMPEPYVSDAQVTLSCRDFAAAGHDLYSEIFWTWMRPGDGCHSWWLGEGQYDFARVERRLAAIVAANPRALILPRLKLNPPAWWLEAHPDELTRHADGSPGQQASLASRLWTETYERMLRDVIGHLEAGPFAGHIFGYHPAGGGSSEWFWWGRNGEVDFGPAAVTRYREWLTDRYGDDAALRRAWGDPTATIAAALPPSPAARQAADLGSLRRPDRSRAVVDYLEILSQMTADNIVRSCEVVKEATGGRKLAGVFYGYSGHTQHIENFRSTARVLASEAVDFLAAPTAYDYRLAGDPGSFISAYLGSYRLHDKLLFDEVDTRTHLFPGQASYRIETLDQTLAVLQRAVGYSLTRGTSLWWFLLAGNATFHQAEVMDAVASLRGHCEEALTVDRTPRAEVAVFIDEASMQWLQGPHRLRRELTRDTIDELAVMGAPHDIYLLDDIADPRLPAYKLYLFCNAVMLDETQRAAIRRVVRQPGRTAAWVFAPGVLTPAGVDLAAASELIGMNLALRDETVDCEWTVTEPLHPICAGLPAGRRENYALSPGFAVDDPEALVLATTAGRPSLALRRHEGWQSVYSLLPVQADLLQGLCRAAGVHLYTTGFDAFDANSAYAMIHTATAGEKVIRLPAARDVSELVTGQQLGRTDRIVAELPAGVTRIYRLR